MSKEEFIKLAEKCGYTKEEIEELIALKEESGIKFDDIPLMEHIND